MSSAIALPPPNTQLASGVTLLRQEVWGPTEDLAAETRYVYRLPVALTWDEIVFDVQFAGTEILTIQVLINGGNLFTAPKAMYTNIIHVPKAQWAVAFQSGVLPVDASVELVLNVQSYGPYNLAWNGMGVCLVQS